MTHTTQTTTTESTNTTAEGRRVPIDWSHLTTAQQIRHLEIEGYVAIPDLISPHEVQQIRDELDRLPTDPTDYSDHQRGHRDVQWSDSPHCINLIALPTMLEFLTTLFGDELICTSCHYALSRPGHPGIALHTDAQPLSWTSDFDVDGRTVNSARNRKFETDRRSIDQIR